MEQRWRYEKRDGTPIWLALDPNFLCVYCERPVGSLSCGGPAVCGTCDCGRNPDGSQWSIYDAQRNYKNAWRRFDEMPDDPKWAEYEASHRVSLSSHHSTNQGEKT